MSTTQKEEKEYLDSITEDSHQKSVGTGIPQGRTVSDISANWQKAISNSDHLGLVSNIHVEPVYSLFDDQHLDHYNNQLMDIKLTKEDMRAMRQTLKEALLAWCKNQLSVCEGPAADIALPDEFDVSMDYDFEQVGLKNSDSKEFKPTAEDLQGRISRDGDSLKYRAALSKITCFISDGGTIEGIQFTSTDFFDGTTNVSPRYGRPGVRSEHIDLHVENGNRVQDIKIYYTACGRSCYAYGLSIYDPATSEWHHCGRRDHEAMHYQLERNQYLIGFSGALWHSDDELVALAPMAGNITNYSE
mmetsp:Transcript_12347/g.22366  ORF Transcript_12347/g.22366 Transcript_12347/m.22366 type:complete len:302 (+) Transcript_12347:115-1020(+)